MKILNRLFSRGTPAPVEPPVPVDDTTPDTPVPFGYKCVWFAFKATTPERVADALALAYVKPCNWKAGIERAYDVSYLHMNPRPQTTQAYVFVTPVVQSWVLAVSLSFPGPDDQECYSILRWLGSQFDEVQYFATHRVVELHAWARVVRGKVMRRFAYVGESGEYPWHEGKPTREEHELGLMFRVPDEEDDEVRHWAHPKEQTVMAIAGAWSVDPTKLDTLNLPPSLGLCGIRTFKI